MSWVDGRGGARKGAGRPKSEEVKKAFRVTEDEKALIKKIRLLDDIGLGLLDSFIKKIVKKHTINLWW